MSLKSTNQLPDSLLSDLDRKWREFKNSLEKAKINIARDPRILAALQRVFAFSDFVAQNCIRTPSLISDLIESRDLQQSYSKKDYDLRLKKALVDVQDEATLIQLLRVHRRREMIRIAFRDLSGCSDLSETVKDL